jgi:hypothetical protein
MRTIGFLLVFTFVFAFALNLALLPVEQAQAAKVYVPDPLACQYGDACYRPYGPMPAMVCMVYTANPAAGCPEGAIRESWYNGYCLDSYGNPTGACCGDLFSTRCRWPY